jgi:hypothetical protein
VPWPKLTLGKNDADARLAQHAAVENHFNFISNAPIQLLARQKIELNSLPPAIPWQKKRIGFA